MSIDNDKRLEQRMYNLERVKNEIIPYSRDIIDNISNKDYLVARSINT